MKVWLLVCLVPLSGALGRLLSNRDVQQNDPVIDALRSPENHGSADSQLAGEKRHLLGGREPVSAKEVEGAVDFAVQKLNAMSNNLNRMVNLSVTDITRQVVNGYLYRFTLLLGETGCRKNSQDKDKNLDQCQLTGKREECQVTVWDRRTESYKLSESSCGQMARETVKRSVHSMLGGDGHDYCHIYLEPFRKFKLQYNKLYSSPEKEAYRFQTFCNNMKRIEQLQKTEQGSATYGITKFADISEEEFRKTYLTPKWDITTPRPFLKVAQSARSPGDDIPDRFDWREHGAVTPVKNQGSCGSCWAFSTTGNIEGQWAIKSGRLLSLSEQELVDCDKLDEGCNGGLPSNAYQAIMKLGGLETESEYSYEGRDEKCLFNRSEVAVKINGGLNISSDEEEMKAWLYKNGPISIGINAFAMQFYFGGVSHPWKIFCNPDSLDHGVLIVGYDATSSGEPYWIIKNSWGADWGEKGYYLVYRGAGVCGLNQMCTSALIN